MKSPRFTQLGCSHIGYLLYGSKVADKENYHTVISKTFHVATANSGLRAFYYCMPQKNAYEMSVSSRRTKTRNYYVHTDLCGFWCFYNKVLLWDQILCTLPVIPMTWRSWKKEKKWADQNIITDRLKMLVHCWITPGQHDARTSRSVESKKRVHDFIENETKLQNKRFKVKVARTLAIKQVNRFTHCARDTESFADWSKKKKTLK